MSHFTTINTQIKDIDALRSACTELGLSVLSKTNARGYGNNVLKGEFVIRLKGPFDIALNLEKTGSYGITSDLWAGHVEQEVGKNYGRLLQLYAVHKATREARKKGHFVTRSAKHDGSIKLVIAGVDGLVNTKTNQVHNANDPLEVLQAISEQKERTIFLLKDYHLFLEDPNRVLLRTLRNVLLEAKTKQKTLLMAGCRLVIPPELERELTINEFALPGKEALRNVLHGILESAGLKSLDAAQEEKAIDAASGLTTIEAENSYALSFVQTRTIEPAVVAREKAQAVKKNGLLEIVEAKETLESIGGLDVLKTWLLKRKDAFGKRAKQYGLPTPMDCWSSEFQGPAKASQQKQQPVCLVCHC